MKTNVNSLNELITTVGSMNVICNLLLAYESSWNFFIIASMTEKFI